MEKESEIYWLTQFEPNVQIVIVVAITAVFSIAVYSYFKWLRSM
jgi:hypothetical protein